MIYKRQYLQFNDLVFLDVSANDDSVSFKETSSDFTYGHGSFSPNKGTFVESRTVSFTFKLRMKELPCDARPFYRDFTIGQLSEPGKLWAIQNNQIVWANAKIAHYSESQDSRKDQLVIDVEFSLPEGVWHKADFQRTFLKPWNICDFMECYDFEEVGCPPLPGNCCKCGKPLNLGCTCCDCEGLTKEMALCYNRDVLQELYSCDREYRLIYNCDAAERFFENTGQKICGCGTIVGNLYSNTDLEATEVKIHFQGEVKNPYIEINGNANQIVGTYKDLTIYPDGSLTDGCKDVSVSKWKIPSGMSYGWKIHQGNNRVVIENGNCCEIVCAWIDHDPLSV